MPYLPKTEYQKFIAVRVPQLRKEQPGLTTSNYMRIAATEWRQNTDTTSDLPKVKDN